MRLVSANTLRPGMVLGNTIYNSYDRPLLQKDVVLTGRMIQRLWELHVQYVYIEDQDSKGITVEETVNVEMRQQAVGKMTETFQNLTDHEGKIVPVMLEKKSGELRSVVHELMKQMQDSTDLLTILSDTYLYDSYIFHHSFNVTLYTLAIGRELRMSSQQLELLGMGALLHDIGKIIVPEEVLFKPGALTEEEFLLIQEHTTHGFEILRNLQNVSLLVAHCAFQHHERLDGSGYPRGITGEDMHPFAKIIAVADVFDAITSNRVYRKKMLPSEALEVLYSGSGTLFDPTVVKAFRQAVSVYPNGVSVMLSDQRRGIVCSQNKLASERPNVRILQHGNDKVLPYEVDLSQTLDVVITAINIDLIEV